MSDGYGWARVDVAGQRQSDTAHGAGADALWEAMCLDGAGGRRPCTARGDRHRRCGCGRGTGGGDGGWARRRSTASCCDDTVTRPVGGSAGGSRIWARQGRRRAWERGNRRRQGTTGLGGLVAGRMDYRETPERDRRRLAANDGRAAGGLRWWWPSQRRTAAWAGGATQKQVVAAGGGGERGATGEGRGTRGARDAPRACLPASQPGAGSKRPERWPKPMPQARLVAACGMPCAGRRPPTLTRWRAACTSRCLPARALC